MKNNKYYEKNKEAIKEAAKAWYYKHKEEVIARNKAKRDAIKEAKEAEKAERQKRGEDTKKKYYYNPENLALRKNRKSLDVHCPAYMTCTAYPNGIIVVEAVVSPKQYNDMSITDKEGMRNKRRLEKTLCDIIADTIIIVEHNEVQVYLKSEKHIQEIVDSVAAFIEEFHKANEERIVSNNAKIAKPILQLSIDGDYIAEYESISDAARITDVPRQRITACLVGKVKESGGYKWKFKYEE